MAGIKSGPVATMAFATGIAAGAYFLWQRMGTKSEEEEEDGGVPDVSQETVIKFFDLLNFEQSSAVARFGNQLMQFRGKIPEHQLTELSVTNFESNLAEAQEQILKKLGISAVEMEDASNYYAAQGDKEVQEAMKQLKAMYLGIMGLPADEAAPDLPEDLTAEKMVEAVKAYFASLLSATRTVLESMRAQGKRLDDPAVMMEMHMTFKKQNEAVGNAALKRFGLTASNFEHAIAKFSSNLAVQLALKAGTEEQQKLLQSFMQ